MKQSWQASRPCEEQSNEAILAGPPSLRAKRSNLVSRKGLLHPFGVRNDEYHQSPRRVQAPLVLARSVKDMAIHTDSSSLRGAKQRSNLGCFQTPGAMAEKIAKPSEGERQNGLTLPILVPF